MLTDCVQVSSRQKEDDGQDKGLSTGEDQPGVILEGANAKSNEDRDTQPPDSVDLLAGMPEADKWGIKGLRTLMNNYPDYHAMVVGLDPQTLGLDVGSPE